MYGLWKAFFCKYIWDFSDRSSIQELLQKVKQAYDQRLSQNLLKQYVSPVAVWKQSLCNVVCKKKTKLNKELKTFLFFPVWAFKNF